MSDELIRYLMPLRELEKICKEYYNLLLSGADDASKQKYRDSFSPDPIRDSFFEIFEQNANHAFTMPELTINFPTADEAVCVDQHMRYSPTQTHTHTFYEMIYVLNGTCSNMVEDQLIVMKAGDICIMTPHILHSLSVLDEDSIVINFLIRKSTFNETFLGSIPKDTFLSLYFMRAQYFGSPSKYLLFHIQKDPIVSQVLDLLIWEGLKQDVYSTYLKKNLLRSAFIYLLRNQNQTVEVSDINRTDSSQAMELLNFIYENYAAITRSSLSAHFHFSETHISRMLRKYTGSSLTDLVQSIRMSKACSLLQETKLEIQEISSLIGYNNVEHFHRVFKRYTLMTPLQYRLQKRE